jgi:hypothetical protein
MKKGRATILRKVVAGPTALFMTLGGPHAHFYSGRDDKFITPKCLIFQSMRGRE